MLTRKILLPLFLMLSLAACAAPARVSQMVVHDPVAQGADKSNLADAVSIGSVSGGKETSPLWKSEVSTADFQSALEGSLRSQGILSKEEKGKYILEANLLGMSQPSFGFDFEVTMHANYSLLDAATGEPILQETVTSAYTATVDDALLGVERLKLANEGAARNNIKNFLEILFKETAPTGANPIPVSELIIKLTPTS